MPAENEGLKGSCLCGAVRYWASSATVSAVCHCRDCQKQTGTAFSAIAGVPADSLTVDGAIASYATKGAAGGAVMRFFCPSCGSPIYSEVASTPGVVWLKSGTLDGDAPRPELQLWWSTAQAWAADLGSIEPRLPTNPPGG